MDLLTGGINNPDGHGWAVITRDGRDIIIGKSMKIEDAVDDFMSTRAKHLGGPALFHSRWATHGTVDLFNVHPFYAGHSQQTVMAHNGILPCIPAKGDKRSDTRLFADELLSTKYRRLDKPRAFQAMTNFIGTYNKLVILTVDKRYRENAYIVNEKAGHWDTATGVWHSNYDYLAPTSGKYWAAPAKGETVGKGTRDTQTGCDICGMGWVSSAGYCDECNSCEDCYETKADCLCYQSHGLEFSHSAFDVIGD